MRKTFVFEAGRLELDFVNTRIRSGGRIVDRIVGPDDLIAWAVAADLVEAGDFVATPHDPGPLERARILRARVEAYAGACVDAGGRPPEAIRRQTADAIGEYLSARPVVRHFTEVGGEYRVECEPLGRAIDDVLLPVAESAAELVARCDPRRIGRCEHDACILYFYDETRNRSRRWCSMRTCGNRVKTAAYRARRG